MLLKLFFKRAFHAFSWACHSYAHLAERKTEAEKVKFVAWRTQQASEKQGPEHRATEPEEQKNVLMPAAEHLPGLGAHLMTWPPALCRALSPESVPARRGQHQDSCAQAFLQLLCWCLPSPEGGEAGKASGSIEERLRQQEVAEHRGCAGNCPRLCPLATWFSRRASAGRALSPPAACPPWSVGSCAWRAPPPICKSQERQVVRGWPLQASPASDTMPAPTLGPSPGWARKVQQRLHPCLPLGNSQSRELDVWDSQVTHDTRWW